MADEQLNALAVTELTITYSLADDGEPVIGVGCEGDESLVILLGMLEMAKDTIMSPDWDDA